MADTGWARVSANDQALGGGAWHGSGRPGVPAARKITRAGPRLPAADLPGIETVRIRGRSAPRAPERSVSGPLCGETGFDLGWATAVGEARVPAAEAASQVVVEDGGTDLEEELSSGR